MQKRIQIAFQRRLSHHLHQQYCSNRAYYAASTLGGLTNADQRITEDVEKFAYNISELYSYTFKVPPLTILKLPLQVAAHLGRIVRRCKFAFEVVSCVSYHSLQVILSSVSLYTALMGSSKKCLSYGCRIDADLSQDHCLCSTRQGLTLLCDSLDALTSMPACHAASPGRDTLH